MSSAIDNGTVLVTGASSGIGMAIAREIATRAKRILLVARRVQRLEDLKIELQKKNAKLEVEVFACDLADRAATKGLPERLKEKGVDAVDVLINNAGVGLMGAFDRSDPDKLTNMIDLNVTGPTLLTRALLPGMIARKKGGVINISSGFGMAVMPSFAAYCATKHYVTGFTEALHSDVAGTNVIITQVCPGPVATEFEQQIGNFTGMQAPSFIEISAVRCARAAIRGFDWGFAMVVPGIVMKLVMLINDLSPRFMRRVVASILGRIARSKEIAASSKGA